MKKLFFAPVSSGELYKNFEKTILQGVGVSLLSDELLLGFEESFVKLWGIRDAKKASFNRTKPGDIVCFYKEGFIIGYGTVQNTFVDEALATKLWGVFNNKQRNESYLWPNIIWLTNFRVCQIPFSKIIMLGNYSENFSIRGYLMFNEIGLNNMLKSSNSIENYFHQNTSIIRV